MRGEASNSRGRQGHAHKLTSSAICNAHGASRWQQVVVVDKDGGPLRSEQQSTGAAAERHGIMQVLGKGVRDAQQRYLDGMQCFPPPTSLSRDTVTRGTPKAAQGAAVQAIRAMAWCTAVAASSSPGEAHPRAQSARM